MQYFSFRQSWHERLVGLYGVNGLVFVIILQDIEWGVFFSLSFQTCLLSSVLFFCFSLLKSEECLLKRFFNRPAVNPVYVLGGFPSCVITVALYTNPGIRNNPLSGHSVTAPLQLQLCRNWDLTELDHFRNR